jgi:tetratricopeptide (TPR) repeat protein
VELCQQGDVESGLRLLEQAAAGASHGLFHFALGSSLAAFGRHGEAVEAFRTSVALTPGVAAAWLGMAAAMRQSGDPHGALAPAEQATRLAPEQADGWMVLGNVLFDLGRMHEAVAAHAQAVARAPEAAAAHYNLGNALYGLRTAPDGIAACETAVESYRRATALRPAFAEAWCNLANALYALEEFAPAVQAAQAALAQRPDFVDALTILGNALQALQQYDAAEAVHRRALALQPDAPAVLSNLSVVLHAQERLDEAATLQRRALALDPDFADAGLNHAVTLLTAGDYAAGWPLYEWRWRMTWSPPRGLPQPLWRGEPLAGRTILLHAEQGLGDTLQMVRFAAVAAARGGRVVLEVQAPLVRLLGTLACVAEVHPLGAALPAFDVQCPMFSLPLACGATLETLPNAPYLAADPALAAAWRARLGLPRGRRVGLAWGGAQKIGRRINAERSIRLAELAPLAAVRGVEFHSLQLGPPAAQLSETGAPPGLIDHTAAISDFADTAALVAQLDLVICVDTSVAHLAAAMGRPVWLLSRINGCWRWLTGRDDSPWYPSLRVYRQTTPCDWAPVVARLCRDLAAL